MDNDEAYVCCPRHRVCYVPGAAMLGAYAYALMKDDEKIFSVFYKRVDGGGLVRWRLTAGSQLHELKFLETPEGLPN